MNLNSLKPAWRQFRLLNSIQQYDQRDILLMLDGAEVIAVSKTQRSVMVIITFIVLTLCCQGG